MIEGELDVFGWRREAAGQAVKWMEEDALP